MCLWGKEIQTLPHEIQNLRSLKILDLRGSKLDIPPEILEKYNEPKVILNLLFRHFKRHLNEVKFILVGQPSVGKTAIRSRLIDNFYSDIKLKTSGIDIKQWELEADDKTFIHANVWDFGGQEIMHSFHHFFLTKRSVYLFVLDTVK